MNTILRQLNQLWIGLDALTCQTFVILLDHCSLPNTLADNADTLQALLFFQFVQQANFANQSLDQLKDNCMWSFRDILSTVFLARNFS